MSLEFRENEKISLRAKLDGPAAPPVFVKVVMAEIDCTPIVDGTISLTNCGDDLLFTDKSFPMPNRDIMAIYEVYSDALFTTPHPKYEGKGQSEIIQLQEDIFNPLQEKLIGTIDDTENLSGFINDNNLTGTIKCEV